MKDFLILSTPRSGSNMLISMLRQIEGVTCWGEIFRPEHRDAKAFRKIARAFGGRNRALRFHEQSALEFWQKLVASMAGSCDHFGAKLFYHHREGDPIWDHIRGGNIRILHLYRASLFDTFVSYHVARKTGVWRLGRDQSPSDERIVFDRRLYGEYRERITGYFEGWRDALADRPGSMLVGYDDLCVPDDADRLLSSFFGRPLALIPETRKQAIRPTIDRVSNPAEAEPFVGDTLLARSQWAPLGSSA